LPNVTGLLFDGCSNVTPTGTSFGTYDSSTRTLTFEALPKLTTLSFADCNSQDIGILDLTNCQNVTSLDLRNTQVSVKLVNSKIALLQLGSPISVSITNPTVLGDSGTTLTIQDSTNLTDITLVNVNTTNVHGFNTFNILTSAVS
jgi:hypothetical protein